MKSDNSVNKTSRQDTGEQNQKKTWEPMKLTYAGEAKDIVRSGGGKTSVTLADAGDTNKPKGQG